MEWYFLIRSWARANVSGGIGSSLTCWKDSSKAVGRTMMSFSPIPPFSTASACAILFTKDFLFVPMFGWKRTYAKRMSIPRSTSAGHDQKTAILLFKSRYLPWQEDRLALLCSGAWLKGILCATLCIVLCVADTWEGFVANIRLIMGMYCIDHRKTELCCSVDVTGRLQRSSQARVGLRTSLNVFQYRLVLSRIAVNI